MSLLEKATAIESGGKETEKARETEKTTAKARFSAIAGSDRKGRTGRKEKETKKADDDVQKKADDEVERHRKEILLKATLESEGQGPGAAIPSDEAATGTPRADVWAVRVLVRLTDKGAKLETSRGPVKSGETSIVGRFLFALAYRIQVRDDMKEKTIHILSVNKEGKTERKGFYMRPDRPDVFGMTGTDLKSGYECWHEGQGCDTVSRFCFPI